MGTISVVTGGVGFLGRHLVRRLGERGDEVRVLDVAEEPDPLPGVRYLRGSVTDRAAVRRALEGARRVFHTAAIPHLWTPRGARVMRVNHGGTKTVLEEAARAGVERVVHTSSAAILRTRRPPAASPGSRTPLPEPGDVLGLYCRSKLAAEREAWKARENGLPVVVVSPAAPIGPGDRNLTPPTRMLVGFLNGRYPAFLESTLYPVDVRDVAAAHLRAAERDIPGHRYVLAGEPVRLGDLLRRLESLTGLGMPHRRIPYPIALAAAAVDQLVATHLTGRPPAATVAGVRLARTPLRADGAAAREELGFRPRPLEPTLADTVRWLHAHGRLRRTPADPLQKAPPTSP